MTQVDPTIAKDELAAAPADEVAAAQNRQMLAQAQVLAVALIGPPGAGKTALIEATARQLRGKARVGVIAVNPAAERDANRVSRYCDHAEAVRTAIPDAASLRQALLRMDLKSIDILFIESVGGIAAAPQLGQDLTVTVLGVSGGDDKAAEYANLLTQSQLLILSKAELQRHVMFDLGVFRADARRINPQAELLEISAFEATGLPRWLNWIDRRWREFYPQRRRPKISQALPEFFFG